MSRIHRVRTHVWRNGRLEVKDAIFGSEEEAMSFANNADGHSVKVYDHNDNMKHDATSTSGNDTYA
jgi:hypothetical protein